MNEISIPVHILVVLLIMIVSGILGGISSYILNIRLDADPAANSSDLKEKISVWNFIFIGIVASLIVPIFLHIISSNLLVESRTNNILYLQVMSICIVVAVFARKFMFTMYDKVINMVEKNQKEIKKVKTEVEEAKVEVKSVETKVDKTNEKIEKVEKSGFRRGDNERTRSFTAGDTTKMAELRGPKVRGDQQKNQWGGESERNGRKLSGKVTEDDGYYYRINLKVESTDPLNPLTGKVYFHLHESFPLDVEEAEAVNGIAKITIFAYGAFTVGVTCDDNKTWLELDLADPDVDAPELFKKY